MNIFVNFLTVHDYSTFINVHVKLHGNGFEEYRFITLSNTLSIMNNEVKDDLVNERL